MNIDATWSPDINPSGLSGMVQDHVGCVHLVGLKFIPRCLEVKLLEAMTICFGLENLSSIYVLNILVESNYLEVINLLNDGAVDLTEFSFLIEETKNRGDELRVVSFL